MKISPSLLVVAVSVGILSGCQSNVATPEETVQSDILIEEQTEVEEIETNQPQSEFTITMDDYTFSETDITIRAGEKVTFNLTNLQGNHDLVIDELKLHSEHLDEGASEELTFTVSEEHIGKTYEFYCSVGNHRELGMVGTITIVE